MDYPSIPFTYKDKNKLLGELEKKNYAILNSLIVPAKDVKNNSGLDFILLDIPRDIMKDIEFAKAIRRATKITQGDINLALVKPTEKRHYDATSFYFVYTTELIVLREDGKIENIILEKHYSETYEN